jgi:hypothetical protein
MSAVTPHEAAKAFLVCDLGTLGGMDHQVAGDDVSLCGENSRERDCLRISQSAVRDAIDGLGVYGSAALPASLPWTALWLEERS